MIDIIDFDKCQTNERNGTYGGQAGSKEGITFNDDYWMIKYPKSTKGMRTNISKDRKDFYIKGMRIRLEELLEPAYEKSVECYQQKIRIKHLQQ